MTTRRWSEVREQHVTAAGPEAVEAGKNRLLTQVRAHRLAEIRKRRGLTQRQVATVMGVTVGRVSQIESGDIAGSTSSIATSPLSVASWKSSQTSATNNSRLDSDFPVREPTQRRTSKDLGLDATTGHPASPSGAPTRSCVWSRCWLAALAPCVTPAEEKTWWRLDGDLGVADVGA